MAATPAMRCSGASAPQARDMRVMRVRGGDYPAWVDVWRGAAPAAARGRAALIESRFMILLLAMSDVLRSPPGAPRSTRSRPRLAGVASRFRRSC